MKQRRTTLSSKMTILLLGFALGAGIGGAFSGENFNPLHYTFPTPSITEGSVDVCFTPPRGCTDKIVSVIDKAQNSIYVQIYSFTSKPIAQALLDAHKRGVKVRILADRSQGVSPSSQLRPLQTQGLEVRLDAVPGLAHNKIIIVDEKYIVTGSFNFSMNAEKRNAENVVFITDSNLAQRYLQNWNSRYIASQPYGQTSSAISLTTRRNLKINQN